MLTQLLNIQNNKRLWIILYQTSTSTKLFKLAWYMGAGSQMAGRELENEQRSPKFKANMLRMDTEINSVRFRTLHDRGPLWLTSKCWDYSHVPLCIVTILSSTKQPWQQIINRKQQKKKKFLSHLSSCSRQQQVSFRICSSFVLLYLYF